MNALVVMHCLYCRCWFIGYEFKVNGTLVIVVVECMLYLFGHSGCFAWFLL